MVLKTLHLMSWNETFTNFVGNIEEDLLIIEKGIRKNKRIMYVLCIFVDFNELQISIKKCVHYQQWLYSILNEKKRSKKKYSESM